MKLESAFVTRIGNRKVNEDAVAVIEKPTGIVTVVCDGLGGHGAGDIAAKSVASAIEHGADSLLAAPLSNKQDVRELASTLRLSLTEALAASVEQASLMTPVSDPQTTVVLAVISNDATGVFHIGDSRCYHLTNDELVWRTRDHSIVQLLLDDGDITEEEMGTHPDQGKLFKSIGIDRDDELSISLRAPLNAGEVLLLCSDGFWEFIRPDEMMSLASTNELAADLEALAETAEQRAAGSSDNVSVAVIRRPATLLGRVHQWFR
ncbi:MAG: protein phosphatase 2C domain-containing protein [Pseudomonadota bacterium]